MPGKELFALINSSLNGFSALLLILAYVFVRRQKWAAHGYTMAAALVSSTAFLACYLYSKWLYGEGSTGMPAGWFRTLFWLVLFPHVLLAIVMLPMIGASLYFAWKRNWPLHRRMAFPTWCVWVYVSVTGVLIYFFLYQWYPALYPEEFAKWTRGG